MTGGAGSDVFAWKLFDLNPSTTDVITDFEIGVDVLDLSAVFHADGKYYNPQTFNVNDILELSPEGLLSAKLSGGNTLPVASGITGAADLDALFNSGSLLV